MRRGADVPEEIATNELARSGPVFATQELTWKVMRRFSLCREWTGFE